jgi:hypothetical protein
MPAAFADGLLLGNCLNPHREAAQLDLAVRGWIVGIRK